MKSRMTGSYRCHIGYQRSFLAGFGVSLSAVLGIVLMGNVTAFAKERVLASLPKEAQRAEASAPIDFRAELKLTAEQTGKLDVIHKTLKDQAVAISPEVAEKQAALEKLLAGGKASSDQARVLTDRLYQLREKLRKAQVAMRSEIRALLTPAQRTKLSSLPDGKQADLYALMGDKELRETVKRILCGSGGCPSSVGGKSAPAPVYPDKAPRK